MQECSFHHQPSRALGLLGQQKRKRLALLKEYKTGIATRQRSTHARAKNGTLYQCLPSFLVSRTDEECHRCLPIVHRDISRQLERQQNLPFISRPAYSLSESEGIQNSLGHLFVLVHSTLDLLELDAMKTDQWDFHNRNLET